MRYILDVSGHDLKLIRASIVNFQRSLEMSNHAEFDNIIDDLDHVFFKISRMKKEQLNNKIKRKWWKNEILLQRIRKSKTNHNQKFVDTERYAR